MEPLTDALMGQLLVQRAADANEATDMLRQVAGPGDAVLVKASNTVGLARLVEAIRGG